MSQKDRKFYVVWSGQEPGIYDNWDDCRRQVQGQKGAQYKSFPDRASAEEAFRSSPLRYIAQRTGNASTRSTATKKNTASSRLENPPTNRTDTVLPLPLEVVADAWAVDAACSGNPGKMEYRGVDLRTGQQLFHQGPMWGTNNIGEFLAIVHALALIDQKGGPKVVYTDSRNALLWIRKKKCATKLPKTPKSAPVHDLIERAEKWLTEHPSAVKLVKWETDRWGEIPADFGRK